LAPELLPNETRLLVDDEEPNDELDDEEPGEP